MHFHPAISLDVSEELGGAQLRYTLHPLTRSFAGDKLRQMPAFEKQARSHWLTYFLNFTAKRVLRNKPKERYWNSLGGGGLIPIDLEWPNLRNVLAWADQSGEQAALIELMMLLIHYLDRRALFAERIEYASKAAEAAHTLGQKADEALLRIDGLGWTLIEEGRYVEAEGQIKQGLDIAKTLNADSSETQDLIALGSAFLGRVYIYEDKITQAAELIERAITTPRDPVIEYRARLSAGDLAYKQQDYQTAIGLYKDTFHIGHQYGGENYLQDDLEYRLGFAYLALGNTDRAETEFSQLLAGKQYTGTIEAIYAKYGLACVAQARGEPAKARQFAQEAVDTLTRLRSGHRLLKEIEEFLRELDHSNKLAA